MRLNTHGNGYKNPATISPLSGRSPHAILMEMRVLVEAGLAHLSLSLAQGLVAIPSMVPVTFLVLIAAAMVEETVFWEEAPRSRSTRRRWT